MIQKRNDIQALLFVAIAAILSPTLTGCTDDDMTGGNPDRNAETPLEMEVGIAQSTNNALTRSTNTARVYDNRFDVRYFKPGAEIGVTTTDTFPNYDSHLGTMNCRYTAVGGRDWNYNYQRWYPDSPTDQIGLLWGYKCYLYGYYPWIAGTQTDSIWIRTQDNTDYMYAQMTGYFNPATSTVTSDALTYFKPSVKLHFEHAQSIIRWNVYGEGYFNAAHITKCVVSGTGFSVEAALDARSGRLWNFVPGDVQQTYPLGEMNFKTDTVSDFYFVIPIESVQAPITFDFTVDGYVQTATVPIPNTTTGGHLQHGYVYDCWFKIKSMAIELQDVKIIPWDSAGIATEDMSPYLPHLDPHDYVDMGMKDANGNPILWAKYNLGAADSSEVGDYYMWGDTVAYSATHPIGPTYYKDTLTFSDISCTRYDPVRRQWGGECRMPTKAEWDTLCDLTKYNWIYVGSGVRGHRVQLKSDPSKEIFLPFTGYRTYNLTGSTGTAADTLQVKVDTLVSGYYWTSNELVTTYPYNPYYTDTGGPYSNSPSVEREPLRDSVGYAIRPVKTYKNTKPYPFN